MFDTRAFSGLFPAHCGQTHASYHITLTMSCGTAALVLLCVGLLLLMVAANNGTIVWNGDWANGCDFVGNDMGDARTSPEQCGPRCASTVGCSHFVWTNSSGGTCWLKNGTISNLKATAKQVNEPSFLCGVVPNWNGRDWALACDFKGRDLAQAQVPADQCGPTCVQTTGCSHYTWTTYNSGTCFMKTGTVSKQNAFTTSDATMVCGVKSANMPTVVNDDEDITWNSSNRFIHWASGCDFNNHDMTSVASTVGQCGPRCLNNTGCSHFAWNDVNSGTCWLKRGNVTKASAFKTQDPTMRCGVVLAPSANQEPIKPSWDTSDPYIHWASGCDFNNSDMCNVPCIVEECGPRCLNTMGCSHFAWNDVKGGTCWLKMGNVTKAKALTMADPTMRCGVVLAPSANQAPIKPSWDTSNQIIHWASSCDFNNNDMCSVTCVIEECGPRCLNTMGCSHFAWSNGRCWLKMGNVTKDDAITLCNPAMRCGIVQSWQHDDTTRPPAPTLRSNVAWQAPGKTPRATVAGYFCLGANGDDVGICNLKGCEIEMGSAGDLLVAGRFKDFTTPLPELNAAGKMAYPEGHSTDGALPWIIADYVTTVQASSSGTNVHKTVDGTSTIDLFLCGNHSCDEIADMHFFQPTVSSDDDARAFLGFRVSRIAPTLFAVPLSHVDPKEGLVRTRRRHDLENVLEMEGELLIEEVWYAPPNMDILHFAPIMVGTGEWARAFADKGWSSTIRVGTFIASNLPPAQQCITVISPIHPWMDAHGWNISDDCTNSSGVYIFSSYLPQAFLWDEAAVAKSTQQRCFPTPVAEVVRYYVNGSLGKPPGNLTHSYMQLSEEWNLRPNISGNSKIQSFGRRLHCDDCKQNKPTGAGCYVTQHMDPQKVQDVGFVAVIGTAPVLLMKMTDDAYPINSTPDSTTGHRHLTLQDYSYDSQSAGSNPGARIGKVDTVLLTLTRMSQLDVPPWCDSNSCYHHFASDAPRGHMHLRTGDDLTTVLNCTLWDELGLGFAHPELINLMQLDGNHTPASTLSEVLTPGWVNLSESWPNGFAGRDRPTRPAIRDGVNNLIAIATSRLSSATSRNVSVTDATATWQGGVTALVLCIVSIVAVAVGRKDMESTLQHWCKAAGKRMRFPCFHLQGTPEVAALVVAKVLVAVVAGVSILFPALVSLFTEIDARRNNNFTSTVFWLQVPALGYGNYHLLAALSQSFSPVYDNNGQMLIIATVVLAVVAVVALYGVSARHMYTEILQAKQHDRDE